MATARVVEEIKNAARRLASVDEGASCTQTSFKRGGKAFLYVGEQGGRHKVMFKLHESRDEAERLAAEAPDDFQVGTTAWVTARFSEERPLAKRLWQRWLKESYKLSTPPAKPKRTTKKRADKR